MIYEFDFEITGYSEFIMKDYSCKYNKKIDSSKLNLSDEKYRYLLLDADKIIEYNYSNINDKDIIVMGWK